MLAGLFAASQAGRVPKFWILVDGHPHGSEDRVFFAMCRCTAFSSKDAASRSMIRRAPVGHSPIQAPSPSQNVSETTRAFPSMICNAPSAHPFTQFPHPSHNVSSISIILRNIFMESPSNMIRHISV
jgi:hypothetical protein